MRPILALAALAAAVVLLRRMMVSNHQSITPDADDSEVVGMPTTWDGQLLHALGLDPARYTVSIDTSSVLDWTAEVSRTLGPGWYVEFAPTSRN